MEYILLLLVLMIGIFFDFIKYEQKKNNIFLYFFITLSMIMLAGFRKGIGVDYVAYSLIYEEVYGLEEIVLKGINYSGIHGEYLYLFINSLIKTIFGEFAFVILTMAVLSVGLVSYACYKYSPFPFTSILIYYVRFYFLRDMEQIRSAVACGIILLSINTIVKRKFLQFCILMMLAMLFHKAAIIAFPVYFLSKNTLKNNVYYLGIVIMFFIGIMIPFKDFLLTYFVDSNLQVIIYALDEVHGRELGVLHLVNIMQALFLIIFILKRKILKPIIYGYDTMINMYALSTWWMLAFQSLGIIAGRFSTMITTIEIILLPSLIICFNNGITRYIFLTLLMLWLAIQIYFRIEGDLLQRYLPYTSIFE